MKENNLLIAEFLGLRECARCEDCGSFYANAFGEFTESGVSIYHPKEMNYHSRWNWLMTLVEKVESIKDETHGYFGVHISSNSCTIQGTNFRSDKISNPPVYFDSNTLESKLDSTYYTIINFIKWYNKNIKDD